MADDLTTDAWPEGTPDPWTGGEATPKAAVTAYQKAASQRSEIDRQAADKAKTGVFTGSYATNPATGGQIPVFVADYVLMGYGTGAIMAVPAHDQRDFDFARAFGLPIRSVVEPDPAWRERHGLAEGASTDDWPEASSGPGVAIASTNDGVSLDGLELADAKAAIIAWLEADGYQS